MKNDPASSRHVNVEILSKTDVKPMPLMQLLAQLFLQPLVLLRLRTESFWRALRISLTVMLAAGVFSGFVVLNSFKAELSELVERVAGKIESVSLDQQLDIVWSEEVTLPLKVSGETIAFCFSDSELEPDDYVGDEEAVFLITPKKMILQSSNRKGEVLSFEELSGKLQNINNRKPVSGEVLKQWFYRYYAWIQLMGAGIFAVVHSVELFMCIVFMSIVPVLLRSPLMNFRSFRDSLAFYLFAAVPSFLVSALVMMATSIYNVNIFLVVYIAYLFFAFHRIGKFLKQTARNSMAKK